MPNISTNKNQAAGFDNAVRALAQSDLPDDQRALLAILLDIGHDHPATHRFVRAMAASSTHVGAPQELNIPNITLKEWAET